MTRRLTGALLLALLATACLPGPSRDLVPWQPIPEPDPADVETVVFLVGDAGNAIEERSPLIRRLQLDVEQWACRLEREAAVVVVFLGDNVYPEGLRPRGSPHFAADSAHLYAQVAVMTGPCARQHAATAFFVAGNHDWGTARGVLGERRVRSMQDELTSVRQRGINVRLVPEGGTPGPVVIDHGEWLRLVLLDTAWWLLGPTSTERALLQGRLLNAMQTRGEREVLIAAHHPFESAGPHGGLVPLFKWAGIKYLLAKSGAWLQDLSSGPYKQLVTGLRAIFDLTGPPLIFAGGHEHSLQVIGSTRPNDPRHILVSGAASKSSDVGEKDGMRFRSDELGYMRLVITHAGAFDLYAHTIPDDAGWCSQNEDVAREACMSAGAAAFETPYSERLLAPRR